MLKRRYEPRVPWVTIKYSDGRLGMWCLIRLHTGRQSSGCGGSRRATIPEIYDKATPSARAVCSHGLTRIHSTLNASGSHLSTAMLFVVLCLFLAKETKQFERLGSIETHDSR